MYPKLVLRKGRGRGNHGGGAGVFEGRQGVLLMCVYLCGECFFWANDGCVTMSVVSSRMVNGE